MNNAAYFDLASLFPIPYSLFNEGAKNRITGNK